jgi:flagellar hook-associated protein 1 FlgK
MATCYELKNGVENQDLIQDLRNVKNTDILENATCEEFLQSLVAEVAIDVKKQSVLEDNYSTFQTVIQNQRLAIMGVDKDEEAMNLVKYQEAYDLSAKVLEIMQEVYDTLIKSTGV